MIWGHCRHDFNDLQAQDVIVGQVEEIILRQDLENEAALQVFLINFLVRFCAYFQLILAGKSHINDFLYSILITLSKLITFYTQF